MSVPNDLILYGYPGSPYAYRVASYLALRGIKYAQCGQPPYLPRPDLNLIGVNYRRIPLMIISGHVYADTRLILRKLEKLFPEDRLSSSDPTNRGIERLVERVITDAGVFWRSAALIHPDTPLLNDPKFQADREQMTGRKWTPQSMGKGRAEAMVHLADALALFEETFLSDGRKWLTGTEEPAMADLEGAWVFEWVLAMKDLPPQWKERYPKVHSWVKRYTEVVREKRKQLGQPVALNGEQAKEAIFKTQSSEQETVDDTDPQGFKKGDRVSVFPIDSGSANRDVGKLVLLTADEIAIELDTKVILHTPRWNFRVVKMGESSL